MKIVRVKNVGTETVKFKYANEPYTIPAGSESIIPYDAMVLIAGDPSARNVNARQRHRVAENTRLHTKYGAYENEDIFEANKPTIEFYTMEGERVWTVLDDPDGTNSNPALGDEQANATLSTQVSNLTTQLDEIMGMIKQGKLVLADGTGNDESQLDQFGADAAERQLGLHTDPSTLPPLKIAEGPVVSAGDPLEGDPMGQSGPPMKALDDDPENGLIIKSEGSDGPPTDSPKTVKIGGKGTSTPKSSS